LVTNNAHNVFVQLYATLGILGLIAILIPVLIGVFTSIKTLFSNNSSSIDKGITSIFLALWSITIFSIDNISIAVWNYAFLGLVLGLRSREGKNFLESPIKVKQIQSEIDIKKYFALIISGVVFGAGWYSSYPDRSIQKFLANPVNPQDSGEVMARVADIRKISQFPSVLETEYWFLARELEKSKSDNELFLMLELALAKYPKDFNLLDLSAAYREQRGQQVQAIPFRERQLRIEQRHPRIWLSYAYDLRAAGRLSEARAAFEKVKEFQVFLTQDIKDQIPQIEKDFESIPSGN
jgi:tetratricopeptide (TPR) repeat protein